MPNTLTITFAETTPDPQGGYRVKFWPSSSPTDVTTITPNPMASPVVITGLNASSYSGTVEASCGGGTFSTPAPFTGIAGSNGAATLATGTTCTNGTGNYILSGTVGNIVRVRLAISGLLSPTNTAWINAFMGSTSPNFSVVGTSACFQPGSSQGVSLDLFKNITIPGSGTVSINTSIFANNSSSSMISASLTIMTVNGGSNTSTGNTQISGVCVANSSTGGSCPGVSYIGD